MDKREDMRTYIDILKYFPANIRDYMIKMPYEIVSKIQEIRLRSGRPIAINCNDKTYFLNKSGFVTSHICDNLLILSQGEILYVFKNMCDYSIYSYQSEIKNGFITIKGGHRVGVCGTAVISDLSVSGLKYISSINVRIARPKRIDDVNFISDIGNGDVGVLIVGPPACGKTTLLRDMARAMSLGDRCKLKKVVVIDERGEISATFLGNAQNDLGLCDILNLYPKAEGMMHAIRSLSPEVIVCDEIGGRIDSLALVDVLNSGVNVIASMHAGSIEEFIRKKQAKEIMNTGAFKKIVMMKNRSFPGCIEKIYEEEEISDKVNRVVVSGGFGDNGGMYGIA